MNTTAQELPSDASNEAIAQAFDRSKAESDAKRAQAESKGLARAGEIGLKFLGGAVMAGLAVAAIAHGVKGNSEYYDRANGDLAANVAAQTASNKASYASSEASKKVDYSLPVIKGEGINAVTQEVNEAGGHVAGPEAIVYSDGTVTDTTEMSADDLRARSAALPADSQLVYPVLPQVGQKAEQAIAQQTAQSE
ncbi:MAG: hypothetical protein AAB436_04275 [Patescibacteria group bacterium]